MALPVYCTVEDVKRAIDQKETARNDAQVWRAVQSAARRIDDACNRWFYPVTRTAYFEWPSVNYRTPWKLWLDENELVTLTAASAGGTTIPTAKLFLEPANVGPPYAWVEIDRSSSYAFSSGSTPQRALALTGTFGYGDDTESVGTLAIAISSTSDPTAVVVNSSFIGTGDTIKVDSERMLVTKRTFISTGQTVQTPLTASVANTTVAVTSGPAFAIGETLLVDSERLLIVDISGNNLTVKRAWDGSVLATHTGSTVYAPWQLTVVRGLTGTTAATHLISATVYRQVVPAPVRDLAIAYSIDQLLQETGGYARNIVGAGDRQTTASGGSLKDLVKTVTTTFRRTRWGAV
jgi:hypothetical protein